jgi:hypothetical protein
MINGTMPKTRAGNTGLQRHMAYFQFIHSEFKGGKVSQIWGFCQILRGESMTSGTERDIWDESKKKQKSPSFFFVLKEKRGG